MIKLFLQQLLTKFLFFRLADDILDVAVLDVARDIEVHPVTEQIYKEEMQP